jgi:integrase
MLTDTKVKQSRPKASPYKLADDKGLYLYVSPKGAKSWRYDYRFAGKRFTLTLGRYPDMPLAKARKYHQEARESLASGHNPSLIKRQTRQARVLEAADTFKAVGESWFAAKEAGRSKSWKENSRRWLDKVIYPEIGSLPMRAIRPADLLALLKRLEKAGKLRTAVCVRQLIAQIFDFGISNLRAESNPAHSVRKAIEYPRPQGSRPLSPTEIPVLLAAVDNYTGKAQTKYAFRLLFLTMARKTELTEAKWQEIDFEKGEWRVPAERMKGKQEHVVPLSAQATAYFKELKNLAGDSEFVFPHFGRVDRSMSASTLNVMLERIGYRRKFSPHGIRKTASTQLNEQGFRADVIERQLAHVERDLVRATYNKAEYLVERRQMLQQWADYLDGLCAGADVVPIRRKA